MRNLFAAKRATLAAAALGLMVLATPPALAVEAPPPDLIEDRPDVVATVATAAAWSWEMLNSGIALIAPPSPHESATTLSEEDSIALTKLLYVAGYKLKEIENGVGVIPSVSFKFAMVRELSDADWDFLDGQVESSKVRHPGMYADLQRTIVATVMKINGGPDYHVSELKVQILPLPKVQFNVTPKETALSEESSALMRAVQKVDKRLRAGDGRSQGSARAAAVPESSGRDGEWLVVLAGIFLVLALLAPILPVDRARPKVVLAGIGLAGAGSFAVAYGVMWSLWPAALGGGLAAAIALMLLFTRVASEAAAAVAPASQA